MSAALAWFEDPEDIRPDHPRCDNQQVLVGPDTNHPQAKRSPAPKPQPPAGSSSDSGQLADGTQECAAAVGADSPAGQQRTDTHAWAVGGGTDRNGSAVTIELTTPRMRPSLADPFLALAADVLDDLEANRMANANRLGHLTRSEPDEDGIMRGLGMDERHPDVARLAALVDMLAKAEHQAALNLQARLRKHPLGPWVKAQKGVGEKQAARLLAIVGDPYINAQTGQPRTVSQLWSYCGHGDPTRRKRKGMTQADLFALGNPIAKSRTWLIACAVLKAQGPLSVVYYERKAATEDRLHVEPCVRCGPSGKPAEAGSPWPNAHRHADALRVTGKAILRDLWHEAKRLHEAGP